MIQQSRIQEPPRAEIVPEAIVAARVEEYRAPAGVIGRASWGAILAGTVTAIASQIVLTVLGLAIGLSVVDPGASQQGFGLGAGIWWLITGLVSLFLGGLVTGWLCGYVRPGNAALHGFITWCTVTAISAFLVTSAGGAILGGALGAMGNMFQGMGTQVAQQLGVGEDQQVDTQAVQQEIQLLVQQRQEIDPSQAQQAEQEVLNAVLPVLQSQQPQQADRENAIIMLITHSNLSRNEAQQILQEWESSYGGGGSAGGAMAQQQQQQQQSPAQQPQQQQEMQQAADTAAGASWWTLVALLLGAAVAAIGGWVGVPSRERHQHREEHYRREREHERERERETHTGSTESTPPPPARS